MKKIFTTTLRLNLENEDDRRAWDHLRQLDKDRYRSYSKAIVAAVNDYFARLARLDGDPYLETREKEDAFLRRVLDTIEAGLKSAPAVTILPARAADIPAPLPEGDEDMAAALSFADSF